MMSVVKLVMRSMMTQISEKSRQCRHQYSDIDNDSDDDANQRDIKMMMLSVVTLVITPNWGNEDVSGDVSGDANDDINDDADQRNVEAMMASVVTAMITPINVKPRR